MRQTGEFACCCYENSAKGGIRIFWLCILAYGFILQQGLIDTLNLYGGETCVPRGAQPGIIVHYAALYDAPTWGVPKGPSTGMIVHVFCCFGPSRSRCVPGPRGLFFFESMFIALPFDPTQYEVRSPSPVRTPEPGPRGLPFDPTEYEDRSPSLVRTPEPLRVQKARKKQRLVARAAADAEREREWAEMYRMFAHDSVEQRRELEFISLIQ
jgi:hypothetical protein